MALADNRRLFSVPFVLISLTSLVYFTSFQFLVPTLPLYLTKVVGGSEAEIGLVMGSHTLMSMTMCALLGRQIDRFGRKPMLLLGMGAMIITNSLYLFANSVPLLILLRLLTGASLGTAVTALNTIVTDLAPANRRGEAVGYFNLVGTACMAVGPLTGVALMNTFGFPTLFLSSAAVSLASVLIALTVPETMAKHAHKVSTYVSIEKTSHLLRVVRLPGMVMFTVTAGYGAVQSFLPLYATSEGVDNPGLFFTVYAIVLMFTRLFAGKLSDRFGRRAVIIPGLLCAAIAVGVLSIAGTMPAITLTAMIFAVGMGFAQIGLMTLVVDAVSPTSRGAALGYFQACFEIGFGSASVAAGVVAQSVGFHSMYMIAGLIPLAGFATFLIGERAHHRVVEAGFRRAESA